MTCKSAFMVSKIYRTWCGESRRPEGRRLRISGSGDDAPMLAGEIGVSRDRLRRGEVEVALER